MKRYNRIAALETEVAKRDVRIEALETMLEKSIEYLKESYGCKYSYDEVVVVMDEALALLKAGK